MINEYDIFSLASTRVFSALALYGSTAHFDNLLNFNYVIDFSVYGYGISRKIIVIISGVIRKVSVKNPFVIISRIYQYG